MTGFDGDESEEAEADCSVMGCFVEKGPPWTLNAERDRNDILGFVTLVPGPALLQPCCLPFTQHSHFRGRVEGFSAFWVPCHPSAWPIRPPVAGTTAACLTTVSSGLCNE